MILGGLGLLALASWVLGRQPSAAVGQPIAPRSLQPVISNEETWEWKDWTGKNRSITIHRTVKTDE